MQLLTPVRTYKMRNKENRRLRKRVKTLVYRLLDIALYNF